MRFVLSPALDITLSDTAAETPRLLTTLFHRHWVAEDCLWHGQLLHNKDIEAKRGFMVLLSTIQLVHTLRSM
jgi:hypothetical protein